MTLPPTTAGEAGKLYALLARLVPLTEPSREVDWELSEYFGWFVPWASIGTRADLYLAAKSDDGAVYQASWGNGASRHLEPYTASLDAAIALVERVAPDRYWQVAKIGGDPHDFYEADIADRPSYKGQADIAAVALLIALIRTLPPPPLAVGEGE